jgi:CelD/BcsL family acetyltransferase involved in cellulose biosynthesis
MLHSEIKLEEPGMSHPMSIHVTLDPPPPIEMLEARWRDLEARADATFYTSWSWIGNWLRVLPADLAPSLLVARQDGHIVGMGIVVRSWTRLLRLVPVRCWYLHATGRESIDELTIEYNDFLARRDEAGAIRRAMLDHLLTRTREGRVEIKLATRALADAASQRLSRSGRRGRNHVLGRSTGYTSYMVDLDQVRARDKGYLSLLSSNTRSQVRRSMAAYQAVGPLRVEEAGSVEQAQAFMSALRTLHGQVWLNRGEHSGFAFSPVAQRFHDALIAQGWPCGDVQLLRVCAGNEPIGYLYNLVHQGHVVYYQSGLRYGLLDKHDRPGLVCHSLAIEHNARAGHLCYDFAAGDYRYKHSLSTHCEPQSTHVLMRDGFLNRLDHGLRMFKQELGGWRRHLKVWRRRVARAAISTLLALAPAGQYLEGVDWMLDLSF